MNIDILSVNRILYTDTLSVNEILCTDTISVNIAYYVSILITINSNE